MPYSSPPRSISRHREELLKLVSPLCAREVPVNLDLLGRVLSAAPTARLPIPPFSNSAMDGFLVHAADLEAGTPVSLEVIKDVAAGARPVSPQRGQAVRIMTGAAVPEENSHLQVVPVENTNIPPGPVPLPQEVGIQQPSARRNIRSEGENLRPGQVVCPAYTVVDPGALAALISAGIGTVAAVDQPRVAVISSGDELISTAKSAFNPSDHVGKLPDSNGPMLAGLLTNSPRLKTGKVTLRHTSDNVASLARLFDELSQDHDVIITTGGVSVGAYDVVRAALGRGGCNTWFGHVEQKPGGPQGLGLWKKVPVICLPGNPVAAFVSFHLYVTPVLERLLGLVPANSSALPPAITALTAASFPVPKDSRTLVVPAKVSFAQQVGAPPTVVPFTSTGLGSHHVGSLAGVNAYVLIDREHPASDGRVGVHLI